VNTAKFGISTEIIPFVAKKGTLSSWQIIEEKKEYMP